MHVNMFANTKAIITRANLNDMNFTINIISSNIMENVGLFFSLTPFLTILTSNESVQMINIMHS